MGEINAVRRFGAKPFILSFFSRTRARQARNAIGQDHGSVEQRSGVDPVRWTYADLAREVVSRNPDVIVPISASILQAFSAATSTIPIVASGADISLGFVPSLARLP